MGLRWKEQEIQLDVKKLKQRDSFVIGTSRDLSTDNHTCADNQSLWPT